TTFTSNSELRALVPASLMTLGHAGTVSVNVVQVVGQSTMTSNTAVFTVTGNPTTNTSTVVGTGLNITGTANKAQDFTVAQFTDGSSTASPGRYAVAIDFGDGTPVQGGRVTQPGGSGTAFLIDASHTYTQVGTFTVHVRIFGEGMGSAETFSTATVVSGAAPQGPTRGSGHGSGMDLLGVNGVQRLQGERLTANLNTVLVPIQ